MTIGMFGPKSGLLLLWERQVIMSKLQPRTVCPSCETEIKDDVTIEDHGVCFDCHHEMLLGERCRLCMGHGHVINDCPFYLTEEDEHE